MRRRTLFGGSIGFGLLVATGATAQTGRSARIGLLANAALAEGLEAFTSEMTRLGYTEGRNLALDRRLIETAEHNAELAAALVKGTPDLLIGAGTQQVQALQRAAGSIPVVFVNTGDPIGQGLVASLARPGGNTTGIANFIVELAAKQLELIVEAAPQAKRIAVFHNPTNPVSQQVLRNCLSAAPALRVEVVPFAARSPEELREALDRLVAEKIHALAAAGGDIMIQAHSRQIAEFALQRRLPTIFNLPRDARSGGLIAYGSDVSESYRRAAVLADKILKGAKPADLPVEQPTKFNLIVNLKTAAAIGLRLPPSLLGRADEVIE